MCLCVCAYRYKVKTKPKPGHIHISKSVQGHSKENHVFILYTSVIEILSFKRSELTFFTFKRLDSHGSLIGFIRRNTRIEMALLER